MLLVAVAGSAVLTGGWWLSTGPMLAITSVQISGYTQPDQAEMVRTVQIVARRGTMLRLPTVDVREALVARYPWVQDVALHHNWLRGVDVKVTQATPAAVVTTGDGRRLVVSDAGRVLGEDQGNRKLPTYALGSLAVGAHLRGSAQRAPFEVLTAMSPDTARRVRDLRLQGGVLVAQIADGPELRLGPPRQLWAKGRSVDAVLGSKSIAAKVAAAEYLDVSSPKQPTLGGIPAEGEVEASTEGQALVTE